MQTRVGSTSTPERSAWPAALTSIARAYVCPAKRKGSSPAQRRTFVMYPHTPNSPSSKLSPARPACRGGGRVQVLALLALRLAGAFRQRRQQRQVNHRRVSVQCCLNKPCTQQEQRTLACCFENL